MMRGFGQATPDAPQMIDDKTVITRTRLTLEEAFEFADAAGVEVHIELDGHPVKISFDKLHFVKTHAASLKLMVDACADISVVNTGALVAMGVTDVAVLETVDANNLLKVARGHLDPETGKFIKPKDHLPPDFAFALRMQGADMLLVE